MDQQVRQPQVRDVEAVVIEALSEYQVQVLAIYLVGSRAFGVHTNESDFDFLVVVGAFVSLLILIR